MATPTSTLSTAEQTASQTIDQTVPVDEYGNVITDEGDPAYLAGALADALKFFERDYRIKRFLKQRTVQQGHRTKGKVGGCVAAPALLRSPSLRSAHGAWDAGWGGASERSATCPGLDVWLELVSARRAGECRFLCRFLVLRVLSSLT